MAMRRPGPTTRPSVPAGATAVSKGEKRSLRALLREWFGSAEGPGLGGPAQRRRRIVTAGLIAYLVLLVAGGLLYNVPVLNRQGDVREMVESGALKVASLARLTGDLEAETLRRDALMAQRKQRYRELPAAVDLPIVLGRIERLPTLSGGTATGIDYSEPRWENGAGRLQTHASFRGSLRQALAYVSALKALFPTTALERFSVRLDGAPGRIAADMLMSVAVLEERPAEVSAWDSAAGWERAEAAAPEVALVGHPFTPDVRLWQRSRDAGLDLPELKLAGVARRGGEVLALVVYDGEGVLARPGSRVGQFEVVQVDADGIVVAVEGRRMRLEMTGTSREPGSTVE